jgi:hypothetical protein
MGKKAKIFVGLVVLGAAIAIALPMVPGYWLASDDQVKRAVRAIYGHTAELRKTIGGELLYAKQIEPDASERQDPEFGRFRVRVNESGTIVARSEKYDVVLVFLPLPGGKTEVPWRCRVSPAAYVIEGCEAGGEE